MRLRPRRRTTQETKHRILLLAAVTATMSVGTFFLQGWRAALFALLGGAVVTCLVIAYARHSAGRD